MVRENLWKMTFFSRSGKNQGFFGWSGKSGRLLEESGNLKINGYWASETIFILFKGKECYILVI